MKSKLMGVLISPRKMGLVSELVRSKPVNKALQILRFTNKKGAKILYKVIFSASSNAKKDLTTLVIDSIHIGRGAILKRWLPRARGGSDRIKKYTSNIEVYLKELPHMQIEHNPNQDISPSEPIENDTNVMEEK